MDDTPRDGPANMAVDEWLLGSVGVPVLRVYRWEPGWGSFGYFVRKSDACQALPGLRLVRRWTGGGIVDHRSDWTYTLALPAGEPLARTRGGEAYRVIHGALAAALRDEAGVAAQLAGAAPPSRAGECFRQPAEHDILDAQGKKIAGAGQRRTAAGLLHQGSLALAGGSGLAHRLAAGLARTCGDFPVSPPADRIAGLILDRYASRTWMERR